MVKEMIKLLMDAHNSLYASPHNLRFLTVVVLCFAGFMRIDELLTTQLKHMTIKDRHMEIFLAEWKTSKTIEGSTIFISSVETKYCPVALVEKYLRYIHRSLAQNKDSFLICWFSATKKELQPHATLGIGYNRTR